MRIRLSLVIIVLALFAAVWGVSVISGLAASASQRQDEVAARAVIARERAAFDAWQRKDKAFFEKFMADDSTYFGPMNPYLETDPKQNFLPKLDKYTEIFKYEDFQIYNPRVQLYGDTAILTYTFAAMVNMSGRTMNYTGKMTSVYVRQGDEWRVAHGHESINPGAAQ